MVLLVLLHKRTVQQSLVTERDESDCEWFWHDEQLQQHHLKSKKRCLKSKTTIPPLLIS